MKKFSINEVDFSKYNLIIFDLDNTLYLEKDYLFEVYEKIAEYTEKKYGLSKELSFDFLKNYFEKKGRENLLDIFIEEKQINRNEIGVFLHIMRNISLKRKLDLLHLSKIKLMEAISVSNVCIVTNGNPIQQKNKIKQINWGNIKIKKVYYANEIAPKPSKEIFKNIQKDFRLTNNHKTLMIGDSEVDKDFAKNIGADYVFIK